MFNLLIILSYIDCERRWEKGSTKTPFYRAKQRGIAGKKQVDLECFGIAFGNKIV